MTLLPEARSRGLSEEERMLSHARAAALQNAVVTLLNMTIADKDGVIYAFGSAFADSGEGGRDSRYPYEPGKSCEGRT